MAWAQLFSTGRRHRGARPCDARTGSAQPGGHGSHRRWTCTPFEGREPTQPPVADAPGFPCAITDVIAELRSAQLTSSAVENVAPDLVPMVRAYGRELAEGSSSDWPAVLRLATEAMTRHKIIVN
jgi:hypothetical protein